MPVPAGFDSRDAVAANSSVTNHRGRYEHLFHRTTPSIAVFWTTERGCRSRWVSRPRWSILSAGRSYHKPVSRCGFCVISLPTDAGRDCTLRATCVQKTTCSDLSQIKYVRWSSAFHGRWGIYWLPRSLNQGGRAMETGMGNASVIE
jgi:hypothetical protein